MDFQTIGIIAGGAGLLAYALGAFRSKKPKPPVELEEAVEEEYDPFDDVQIPPALAQRIAREHFRKSVGKTLSGGGRGGSQGARRGAPPAEMDDEELPN